MVNSANHIIALTSPLSSDGTSFTDTFQSSSTTTTTTHSTSTTATTTSHTSTTTTSISSTSNSRQLNVRVSTDSPTYVPGDVALISVSVTHNGQGVRATVKAVITLPNGNTASGQVTTGYNGKALFEYTIPNVLGVYQVKITATASGYSAGIGTTSFSVT